MSSSATRNVSNSTVHVCYTYSCHLVQMNPNMTAVVLVMKLRIIYVKFWIVKHLLWKSKKTRPLKCLTPGWLKTAEARRRFVVRRSLLFTFTKCHIFRCFFYAVRITPLPRHVVTELIVGWLRHFASPTSFPVYEHTAVLWKGMMAGSFCWEMISSVWELWRWYGIICDCILKCSCTALLMSPYASLQWKAYPFYYFIFFLPVWQITPGSQGAVTISVLS